MKMKFAYVSLLSPFLTLPVLAMFATDVGCSGSPANNDGQDAGRGIIIVGGNGGPHDANASEQPDGRTEGDGSRFSDLAVVWPDNTSGTTQVSIAEFTSNGQNFQAQTSWAANNGGWNDKFKWMSGDFNADGLTDIAAAWTNDGTNVNINVRQSDGTKFIAKDWALNAAWWIDSEQWVAGDFNGDGKTDLALMWPDGSSGTTQVSIVEFTSNGTSFQPQANWGANVVSWNDKFKWMSGDFNGDGLADIALAWTNDGNNASIKVLQSDGTKFIASDWALNAAWWSDNEQWVAGDFNGDGKTDLAVMWPDNSSGTTQVSIVEFTSTGTNFGPQQSWAANNGSWNDKFKWMSGDFNGDGLADIATVWTNDGNNASLKVRQSDGAKFNASDWALNAAWWSDNEAWVAGRFR